MKRFIAAIAVSLSLVTFAVPAQAQKTKAALTTEINANFADNTTGLITATLLRTTVLDIVASYTDWLTCTTSGGIMYWDGTAAPACLVTGTANQILVAGTPPSYVNIASLLTAGTGITKSGTANATIAITNTAVTPAAYGSATQCVVVTFNQQGQATGASAVTCAPAFASITGTPTTLAGYGITSPLPVAQGGSAAVSLTAHGVLLGEGTSPFVATAAMTDGQILVGQTGADPLPKTAAGDVTLNAGGTFTIGVNKVANTQAAQMAAYTFKGNATGSLANAQDFTIAGLTHKGSPTGADLMVLSDTAASAATKYASITEIIGAVTSGVSSIAGNTGAFTLSTGIVNSTNDIRVDKATASNYFSGTSNKVVTADVIFQPETTVTFGATTTFDFNTFVDAIVTLTGNITTATFNNAVAGKKGHIRFIQDGTGSRTIPATLNSIFKCAGAACNFVLSTAASAIDVLYYDCATATFCTAQLSKAYQ